MSCSGLLEPEAEIRPVYESPELIPRCPRYEVAGLESTEEYLCVVPDLETNPVSKLIAEGDPPDSTHLEHRI